MIGGDESIIYLSIMPLTIILTNYLIYTQYRKFRTFLLGLLLIFILFETFKL